MSASPRTVVAHGLVSLGFALGCSSASVVTRPDRLPQEERADQAKMIVDDFAGKEVKVELESPEPKTGARHYQAMLATSAEGKGFLLLAPPAPPGWVAFESVRRIQYRNRLWGAGEGVLIGTVVGVLTGLLAKASFESRFDCSSPSGWTCNTPSAAEVMIPGALAGAAIGAFTGLVMGHRKAVDF